MNENKIAGMRKAGAPMRLTGAGVLVYTIHDNEIFLLLGKERETPGWRQGSHKWSTFSGKVDTHETSLQAAAREFVEETCASVPLGNRQPPTDADAVKRELAARARLLEQETYYRGEYLVYHTYIVRVPYTSHEELFQKTRQSLLSLDLLFRKFYRLKKNIEDVPKFCYPGYRLSTCITTVNFHVRSDLCVDVYFVQENGRDAEYSAVTVAVEEHTAAALADAEKAWNAVVRCVMEHVAGTLLTHPAVRITWLQGRVVGAFVDKAFLEKCEIGWWKLEDIERARDDKDSAETESQFRRLFLYNVKHLAHEIRGSENMPGKRADASTTPFDYRHFTEEWEADAIPVQSQRDKST